MKTVKLMTCNDAATAHILQGALENEDIDSVLHNENFSSLMKSCISNIAGVDVFVMEEDYERAIQVLKENQSWPEELTLCPHCGSNDIKMRLKKGQRMRAVGAAVMSIWAWIVMMGAVPPGNDHWEYVCKQCKRTFGMPVAEFKPLEEKE